MGIQVRFHARLINPTKELDRPQERWGNDIAPLQAWARDAIARFGGEVEILEMTWAVVSVITI
jgi:hypothetical protein